MRAMWPPVLSMRSGPAWSSPVWIFGRSVRVTATRRSRLSDSTRRRTLVLGELAAVVFSKAELVSTSTPSIPSMMSPAFSPALSAGDPDATTPNLAETARWLFLRLYEGTVRIARRVLQSLLDQLPTPERYIEAFHLRRIRFEIIAERKL